MTHTPASGRPEFNDPVEHDIESGKRIIYLNKEQSRELEKDEKRYRDRLHQQTLRGDGEHFLDTKMKLEAVSILLSQGYAQNDDILMKLTDEERASVPVGKLADLVINAMRVVGTYNTGKKELIARLYKKSGNVREHAKNILNDSADTPLSPLEREIHLLVGVKPAQVNKMEGLRLNDNRKGLLKDFAGYVKSRKKISSHSSMK